MFCSIFAGHDVIPRYKALQIAVRMGLDLVEVLHVSFSFSVVCAQVLAIFISHGYLATRADPPEIKPFRYTIICMSRGSLNRKHKMIIKLYTISFV